MPQVIFFSSQIRFNLYIISTDFGFIVVQDYSKTGNYTSVTKHFLSLEQAKKYVSDIN